jgi:hypothetical protein
MKYLSKLEYMQVGMYSNQALSAKEKLKKLTCVMFDKRKTGDYHDYGCDYETAEKRHSVDRQICRGFLQR